MKDNQKKTLLKKSNKINHGKSDYFNSISKYTLLIYIPASILMFQQGFEIEKYYEANGYQKTDPMNYFYMFIGTIYSGALFWMVSKVFHNFIKTRATKILRTTTDINKHFYLIKNMIFGIIYYTSMVIINYYLIYTYNPEFLPKSFGGSLDVTTFVDEWPQKISNPVRILFVFSIGKSFNGFNIRTSH